MKRNKHNKYKFVIISPSVILRMRNVSDKYSIEYQNTLYISIKFLSENRGIFLDKMEKRWGDTLRKTI